MAIGRTNAASLPFGKFLFPDISDGTPLTIYSNRIVNVTKNYSKQINDQFYIEIEGDLSITTSASGLDTWLLCSIGNNFSLKQYCLNVDSSLEPVALGSAGIQNFSLSKTTSPQGIGIILASKGQFTANNHVHFQGILYSLT